MPALKIGATVATTMLMVTVAPGCRSTSSIEPQIEFTRLPEAGEGSPFEVKAIEGTVTGAKPGQRIVLFARAGVWWVQPLVAHPFTEIKNSGWKSTTHPGSEYAALLVGPDYNPPPTTMALPEKGVSVFAIKVAEGPTAVKQAVKTLHFSGYEWEVRQTASEPGGSLNMYDPANASVDKQGFLHLRIAKRGSDWTSAEVRLSRSLGYGSYRFVVQDVSQLESAAVLNLSIWDNSGPPHEMDVEISRWGELNTKNAQYVIQPFYVPANVIRFLAPPGVLTQSFSWAPGKAMFKTVRGSGAGSDQSLVARHVFTSGIPSPGNESIHMNLYVFDNKSNPLKHASEVIIEDFEYLP